MDREYHAVKIAYPSYRLRTLIVREIIEGKSFPFGGWVYTPNTMIIPALKVGRSVVINRTRSSVQPLAILATPDSLDIPCPGDP